MFLRSDSRDSFEHQTALLNQLNIKAGLGLETAWASRELKLRVGIQKVRRAACHLIQLRYVLGRGAPARRLVLLVECVWIYYIADFDRSLGGHPTAAPKFE